MKVLALNGSARKDWNTAKMLQAALEGAKDAGAEVKMVDLFDLNYKGCHGCAACKLLGGKYYGACAQQDDLTEILEEAKNADVLLLGSPIYFGDVTGMVRNFIERFLFPTLTYSKDMHRLYSKKVKVGLVYTYNAPAETYTQYMQGQCAMFGGMIGPSEYVFAAVYRLLKVRRGYVRSPAALGASRKGISRGLQKGIRDGQAPDGDDSVRCRRKTGP